MRIAGAWVFVMAVMTCALAGPAGAQALDKVSFGTNWVAEAEHGGFYQALADGTCREYGLDVTIAPGGPLINNRILLPVGRLDFFMSANTLQSFDAVEQNVPTVAVAAMFQKDPQVLIAHPDVGVEKFEDLRGLTLFVSKEGIATYFQWLKTDYKFNEARVKPYTFNAQPFLADEQLAYSVATMKEYGIVDSGDATTLGIGAMTDARMASFFDKMVRAGVVKPSVDFRKSYSLQFVNKMVGLELRPKN